MWDADGGYCIIVAFGWGARRLLEPLAVAAPPSLCPSSPVTFTNMAKATPPGLWIRVAGVVGAEDWQAWRPVRPSFHYFPECISLWVA
jgi:hypothetical protein